MKNEKRPVKFPITDRLDQFKGISFHIIRIAEVSSNVEIKQRFEEKESEWPIKHKYDWFKEDGGRYSMMADVTSFGTDANAEKTPLAYLRVIPPDEAIADLKGYYSSDSEDRDPDRGVLRAAFHDLQEGKKFLERWGDEKGVPDVARRQLARPQAETPEEIRKAANEIVKRADEHHGRRHEQEQQQHGQKKTTSQDAELYAELDRRNAQSAQTERSVERNVSRDRTLDDA